MSDLAETFISDELTFVILFCQVIDIRISKLLLVRFLGILCIQILEVEAC